jgi:hypothetical protein
MRAVSDSVVAPTLVRVTVCGVLGWPVGTLPKVSLAGDSIT